MPPVDGHDAAAVLTLLGIDGAPVAEPRFVARGAMGEVWRVDTEVGAFAVKALFPWADVPARPADLAVQLAARRAGVPLPRPVVSPTGDAVVAFGGRAHRAYEWVELGPRWTGPAPADLAAEAGAHLGRIHGLAWPVPAPADGGGDPVDAWYREAPSKDRLAALARAGEAGARPWSYALIASFGLIDELLVTADLFAPSPLAPATPRIGSGRQPGTRAGSEAGRDLTDAIVSHRDFHRDNVLPRAGGAGLVVIDWENCGPVDPAQELASAVVEVATGAGRCDGEVAAAFVAAYRGTGGGARISGGPCFAMAVCTTLNYVVVLADQALSGDAQAEVILDELLLDRLPNLAIALPQLVAAAASW